VSLDNLCLGFDGFSFSVSIRKNGVCWMCCMFGVMFVDKMANGMSQSRDDIILRRGDLSSYAHCL
jgi:hypothetical protein